MPLEFTMSHNAFIYIFMSIKKQLVIEMFLLKWSTTKSFTEILSLFKSIKKRKIINKTLQKLWHICQCLKITQTRVCLIIMLTTQANTNIAKTQEKTITVANISSNYKNLFILPSNLYCNIYVNPGTEPRTRCCYLSALKDGDEWVC